MAERQQVVIDPAVDAILRDHKQRGKRRGMTQAQRAKAQRDAQRRRVCLELDSRVVEMVSLIAAMEACSPAGVVNLLVTKAVSRYLSGEIAFEGHHQESGSPRWGWVIALGEEPDGLLDELQKLGTE